MRSPPIQVDIDARLGGRWSSLVGRSGREWLWRNDVPARRAVRPGSAFVDAGGLEECLPTVGGKPDHGDVWCRPWVPEGDGLMVSTDPFTFRRSIEVGPSGITARYRLQGPPGARFVWAAHAAVDLARGARLLVPTGRAMWVNDELGTSDASWPSFRATDLSRLGDDDGTALMIIVPELRTVSVLDRDDVFTMTLGVEGQPAGVAMWRNLGGWPSDNPYRSIVLEPMLGYSPTLSLARDGEAAVVPSSGDVAWSLTIDG